MKCPVFLLSLISFFFFTQCRPKSVFEGDVLITANSGAIEVTTKKGQLIVNVPSDEVSKFKKAGEVRYSDFGAKGDGKTDDIDAIVGTHAFANLHGLLVKADEGATYYIGGKDRTAIIQTDTDFGTASFIIDDTGVENIKSPVFLVGTKLKSFKLEGVSALKRDQQALDIDLPSTCLITATDSSIKHYIRFGLNTNNGADQTDVFIADKNGKIDMNSPIIWDFKQFTELTALPIDSTKLKITGGSFTTIANRAASSYNYHHRNITIKRSNVIVDGLKHKITGEGDQGAPYGGFISVQNCAYVIVRNSIFTGHKTYKTIGAAGKPVSMGTYDISVNRSLNISFINCSQTNSIDDRTYWGLMASNYCKNLLLDSCTFSRFDAHKGVANATVRNSTLGYMGINAIGSGIFTVENSTIKGRSIINLRSDYGSTWEGEFVVRNCVFIPNGGKEASPVLINGAYTGKHDFGYTCYMPEKITIENLRIEDSNHPKGYNGPAIFSDFNKEIIDDSYVEEFPYIKTKEVVFKNVSIVSGKELRVSDNTYMFKDVKVSVE